MNNLRQQTINSYNKFAQNISDKFQDGGAQVEDINYAFELINKLSTVRVLEIGCGDGRDAREIIKRTSWYLGIDISEELIKLARRHVPEAEFKVADATVLDFPENLDMVFAFASLLHMNKDEVESILNRAYESLKKDGILYISLKYDQEYAERIQEDQFGKRVFYYYNKEILQDMAGKKYKIVKTWPYKWGEYDWFKIVFQKV